MFNQNQSWLPNSLDRPKTNFLSVFRNYLLQSLTGILKPDVLGLAMQGKISPIGNLAFIFAKIRSFSCAFLFLFLFISGYEKTFAQGTTIFSENFEPAPSNYLNNAWLYPSTGIFSWHLIENNQPSSVRCITIPVKNEVYDTSAFANTKSGFTLLENRTFRISVSCSLSTTTGSGAIKLGLDTEENATRVNSKMILQSGSISPGAWQTFTTTFNTNNPLLGGEYRLVLWAGSLSQGVVSNVFVDDISITMLPNLAPTTATITCPATNYFGNNPITISATATDPNNNLAKVEFYTGATLLGEDFSAPYNYEGNLPVGLQQIKVVAVDSFGLQRKSSSRSIRINSAPLATAISPGNNTLYMTSPVHLNTLAEDFEGNLEKVEFYVNGEKVGEDLTNPYRYNYSNTVGGNFSWFAKAVDSLGLWGLSQTKTFRIYAPPSISISTPTAGGTLPSCNVYVQAIANSSTGFVKVQFYRNDTLYSTDSTAPYELKSKDWPAGNYTVKAKVTDNQNNSQETDVNFNVEAATLSLSVVESNIGCHYKISGKLGPNQSLLITNIELRVDEYGNPWNWYRPEMFTAGGDSLAWELPLLLSSNKPMKMYYTLSNAAGCSITDSITLNPDNPPVFESFETVSGLRLDFTTGYYKICSNADSVWLRGLGEGVGRFDIVIRGEDYWDQYGNLVQDYKAKETTTGPEIQIKPEWFNGNPWEGEPNITVRAVSPLGCPNPELFTISWEVLQSPAVSSLFVEKSQNDRIQLLPNIGAFSDTLSFCINSQPSFYGPANTFYYKNPYSEGASTNINSQEVLAIQPVRSFMPYKIWTSAVDGCPSDTVSFYVKPTAVPASPTLSGISSGTFDAGIPEVKVCGEDSVYVSFNLSGLGTLSVLDQNATQYNDVASNQAVIRNINQLAPNATLQVREVVNGCASPVSSIKITKTNPSDVPGVIHDYAFNDSTLLVKSETITFDPKGYGSLFIKYQGSSNWQNVPSSNTISLNTDSVEFYLKGETGTCVSEVRKYKVIRFIEPILSALNVEPELNTARIHYGINNSDGVTLVLSYRKELSKSFQDGKTYFADSTFLFGDTVENKSYVVFDSPTLSQYFNISNLGSETFFEIGLAGYKVVKGKKIYGKLYRRPFYTKSFHFQSFNCGTAIDSEEIEQGQQLGAGFNSALALNSTDCNFVPNVAPYANSGKKVKRIKVAIHIMQPVGNKIPKIDSLTGLILPGEFFKPQFGNNPDDLYILRGQFKKGGFDWPRACSTEVPVPAFCNNYMSVNDWMKGLLSPAQLIDNNPQFNYNPFSTNGLPENFKIQDAKIEYVLERIYLHEDSAYWKLPGHVEMGPENYYNGQQTFFAQLRSKYVTNAGNLESCREPRPDLDPENADLSHPLGIEMQPETKDMAHIFFVECDGILTNGQPFNNRTVNNLNAEFFGGELLGGFPGNQAIGTLAMKGIYMCAFHHPYNGVKTPFCFDTNGVINSSTPPCTLDYAGNIRTDTTNYCYCGTPNVPKCNCDGAGNRRFPLSAAGVLAHEFGHLLALHHTYQNIEEVQKAPYFDPPNDSANNTMGIGRQYFTASQLGKMHLIIDDKHGIMNYDKFLIVDHCEVSNADQQNVTIDNYALNWKGPRNLAGNLNLLSAASLNISCRIGIPKLSNNNNPKVQVDSNSRLNIENSIFTQVRTSSYRCSSTFGTLEFGNQNPNQGLVTLLGNITVEPGCTLRFRKNSNTFIGPGTTITVQGTGSIIFEAESYVCTDPLATIIREEIAGVKGEFKIMPEAYPTIYPGTPNPPNTSCPDFCHAVAVNTLSGKFVFCAAATTTSPIKLIASSVFPGTYSCLDITELTNPIVIPLDSNSENTFSITELPVGESKKFRFTFVMPGSGCSTQTIERTIRVSPAFGPITLAPNTPDLCGSVTPSNSTPVQVTFPFSATGASIDGYSWNANFFTQANFSGQNGLVDFPMTYFQNYTVKLKAKNIDGCEIEKTETIRALPKPGDYTDASFTKCDDKPLVITLSPNIYEGFTYQWYSLADDGPTPSESIITGATSRNLTLTSLSGYPTNPRFKVRAIGQLSGCAIDFGPVQVIQELPIPFTINNSVGSNCINKKLSVSSPRAGIIQYVNWTYSGLNCGASTFINIVANRGIGQNYPCGGEILKLNGLSQPIINLLLTHAQTGKNVDVYQDDGTFRRRTNLCFNPSTNTIRLERDVFNLFWGAEAPIKLVLLFDSIVYPGNFDIAARGQYTGYVQSNTGCVYGPEVYCQTDDIISNFEINAPTTLCVGQDLILSASPVVSGYSYTWTGPQGFSQSGSSATISAAQQDQTGVYTLTVVSPSGTCSTPVSKQIFVMPVGAEAGPPITLCRYESLNDPGYVLPYGVPAGGTWSLNGVALQGNRIFASLISGGQAQLTYTNTGCNASDQTTANIVKCVLDVKANCSNVRKLEVSGTVPITGPYEWIFFDANALKSLNNPNNFWVVPEDASTSTYGVRAKMQGYNFIYWFELANNSSLTGTIYDGKQFWYGDNTVTYNLSIGNQATVENFSNLSLYNSNLFVNGNLKMFNSTAGSEKIIMYNNSNLIVTGSGTISGLTHCPNLWDGIYINGSNTKVQLYNGSQIKHMTNGIVVNQPCSLNVSGAKFEDNYKCFVFNAVPKVNSIITGCTATYAGTTRRVRSEENCWDYFDPFQSLCGESGYSFLSFRLNGDYTNNLKLNGNIVNHYLMGISTNSLSGSGIGAKVENHTFSNCDRCFNFQGKSFFDIQGCTLNLKRETYPSGNFGQWRYYNDTEINYSLILPATDPDKITTFSPVKYFGILLNGVNGTLRVENSLINGSPNTVNDEFGIAVRGAGNELKIEKNKFTNVGTGVQISSGEHNLKNFRCNEFIHTGTGVNRIGLHIRPESLYDPVGPAGALSGDIGSNGAFPNPNPNANVWPRDPNNTAQSPANWVSIQKPDEGGILNYFRYTNEFIGTVSPTGANLNRVFLPSYRVAKSPKAVLDWCTINHPTDPNCPSNPDSYPDWPSDWTAVCSNLDTDVDYFPLRMAVGSSITANANMEKMEPLLGDPIPNPASGKTYLPVFWTKAKGNLVVFELGTGKVITRRSVEKGQQMVELDLQYWSAGLYGYRLEGECPCPTPKRLIVIH